MHWDSRHAPPSPPPPRVVKRPESFDTEFAAARFGLSSFRIMPVELFTTPYLAESQSRHSDVYKPPDCV